MSNIGELNGKSFVQVETFDFGFAALKRTRYHAKRISITNLWYRRSGEAKTLHLNPFLKGIFLSAGLKEKQQFDLQVSKMSDCQRLVIFGHGSRRSIFINIFFCGQFICFYVSLCVTGYGLIFQNSKFPSFQKGKIHFQPSKHHKPNTYK